MITVNVNDQSISRLTLGTVQLGLPYGIANKSGMPDQSLSFQILEEAISGGVNCLDTAISYGDSESVLGKYFVDKEKPFIVSKLVLEIDRSTTSAEIEHQVISFIEGSLTRLKLDKIPVMMLHRPAILLEHGVAITAAFRSAVRGGYAERAGISFGAEQEDAFPGIWKYANADVYEAVQIPINIFDHRLIRSGALNRLAEAGKIVFARSVFLQGMLSMQKYELPEHLSDASPYLEKLHSLAEKEGMTAPQLAVSFVRDLPQIHSLVIGSETKEQVKDNIGLINSPSIGEDTRNEILQIFADVPEYVVSPHLWNRHPN